MDLADRAQRPRPDRLANQPGLLAGLPEVAHLRADLGLGGRAADHAGFVDRVGQRLLAVHVLAHLEGHHRHRRVDVVRRGHDHGVDVLAGLQHLAIIGIERGLGERLGVVLQGPLVRIAEGDDVMAAADAADVAGAHAADADAGDVHFFAGRVLARPAQDVPRHDRERLPRPHRPQVPDAD